MKCVVAQYLLAMGRLVKARAGATAGSPIFRRTVHLTFVPDEEIGGKDGMGELLKTDAFKRMAPVALALDEGLASTGEKNTVFYGERSPCLILITATGPTGHGSRFIQGTATSKLVRISEKALAFRAEQEQLLGWGKPADGCAHCEAKKLGDVTTLNLTMLEAGVTMDGGKTFSLNVIPTSARAGFDIRLTPNTSFDTLKETLDGWCNAEEGVSWGFAPWSVPLTEHHITAIDAQKNPWWGVFKDGCASAGIDLEPEIFPAATDSRFIRQLGIPAFGFSPLANSPILLHEHDEYVTREVFLRGIDIYVQLLPKLCDAPRMAHEKGGAAMPPAKRSKRGEPACAPCEP